MASAATEQLRRWSRGSNQHFNEISLGKSRSPYAGIISAFQRIKDRDPRRVDKFASISLKAFQKDNRLYHLPRMLSSAEYKFLHAGVTQRARALQAFINDHYFGSKSYLKSKIMSKKTIDSIVARSCESKFQKKVDKYGIHQYGFWYGPDIIRGPDGKFYVCEDNLGFVGGLGDLVLSQELLLKNFPEYEPFIQTSSLKKVYTEMIDSYRRMISSEEAIVFLYYPKSIRVDHEEQRLIHKLEALNVYCIILPDEDSKRQSWRIEVDSQHRVFIVNREVRKPVGLIILDCEAFDTDPTHSTVQQKVILDEAEWHLESARKKNSSRYAELSRLIRITRESPTRHHFKELRSFLQHHHGKNFKLMLSRGVPGLLRAYFEGKVKLINGPGMDFLGDKLFCPHLDALIRHYLREEPLLQTIPTLSFGEHPHLISDVFDDPAMQKHVVIKSVNGRCGSEVWVGAKISRSTFLEAKERVKAAPSQFLVQQYIPLSQVDNQLVDLRVICSVSSADVVVIPIFWGRGIPMNKSNGKVNISDHGFEFAVCRAK